MRRCLITGCEGFIGSYLAGYLVDRGLEVYGMVYGAPNNIDHMKDNIAIVRGDLQEKPQVSAIVQYTKPEIVFHLAAQSLVTVSWQDPEETLRTNALGTLYLLEAMRASALDSLVVVVGSSAVYGMCAAEDMPLNEDRELWPTSIYGISKAAEEMLGHLYWRVYGMKVIRVRPFNITGPRKTHDACSDFARGIVEVERGLRESLDVGNLETIRDITDGRDAVNALWLLAMHGEPGEVYNLCSGNGYRMREVLARLIALSGRDITYSTVPEKMRPYDDPIYVGNNSKLKSLGWEPHIPIETTLADLLEYWRQHIH